MLNLIIVDDEYHALQAIKTAVDWQELGISHVFEAANIKEAKNIFRAHPVHLMLCDIEMPQGSGLDLLAWVRERYPAVRCVFLTCHAEFAYAQRAIELGSTEYILKPVAGQRLKEAVLKAMGEVKADRLVERGQLWLTQQPLFVEHFWFDVIKGRIPPSKDALQEAAQARGITYDLTGKFVPVLLSLEEVGTTESLEELRRSLWQLAREIIVGTSVGGSMVQLSGELALALAEQDPKTVKSHCHLFIKEAQERFQAQLSCYVGVETAPHKLAVAVGDLIRIREHSVAPKGQVFLLERAVRQADGPKPPIHLPDAELWLTLLEQRDPQRLVAEARKYLEHTMETTGLDTHALYVFQQDFLQLFYYVLRNKGVQAHQLFQGEETVELQKRSTRSLDDLLQWLEHIVGEFKKQCQESMSVVEQVRLYIAQNINDVNITCKEIADYVGYNPDYLNRIFRDRTGLTIVQYLVQERMEMAKKLLVRTDMQISSVASQVGYTNFSYFAKVFKGYTNMTPSEYRRALRASLAGKRLMDAFSSPGGGGGMSSGA